MTRVLKIKHEVDPGLAILDKLGTSIQGVDVFNSQVLVALYIRPKTSTLGGQAFFLTDTAVDEDRHQSKVGLIIKTGPTAFVDPAGIWFKDADLKVGDWVVFRNSDGWSLSLPVWDSKIGSTETVLCKLMDDTAVRARIPNPDVIY
jgi:hypothetical protein